MKFIKQVEGLFNKFHMKCQMITCVRSSMHIQASKYLKLGTCPASQRLLSYLENNNFH